jgi:hypothetical protein
MRPLGSIWRHPNLTRRALRVSTALATLVFLRPIAGFAILLSQYAGWRICDADDGRA